MAGSISGVGIWLFFSEQKNTERTKTDALLCRVREEDDHIPSRWA